MNRRSNAERTTILERDSSRKLFEKASSMSAKLTKNDCAEFKIFSFDDVLLESKVYRRVCELSWIRELSSTVDMADVSDHGESASITSVSSNGAIASERDCASSYNILDPAEQEPCNAVDLSAPGCSDAAFFNPDALPASQTSMSTSSDRSGESSSPYTNPTSSTLATTVSSTSQNLKLQRDNTVTESFKVVVIVEGIGTCSVDLGVPRGLDQYAKTQEAISYIRDCVLLNGAIQPTSYCGVCVGSIIRARGQPDVHTLPLTPEFLEYSISRLEDHFYTCFDVLARFASSNDSQASCNVADTVSKLKVTTKSVIGKEPTNLFQIPLTIGSNPLHVEIPSHKTAPFIVDVEDSRHWVKGGCSSVWRARLHPEHHELQPAEWKHDRHVAIKRMIGHEAAVTIFRREVKVLMAAAKSRHAHIVDLLLSYHWLGDYHLVFPWADGTLQDFWKIHPTEHQVSKTRWETASWCLQECHGIADALMHVHSGFRPHENQQSSLSSRNTQATLTYYRHADIKPENILWFRSADARFGKGTFKISDFGLTELHSSKDDRASPKTRGGTKTYGAPELEHHLLGKDLTSAYDIWSLGCVLLEFITWYLAGWDTVEEFKRSRYVAALPLSWIQTYTNKMADTSKHETGLFSNLIAVRLF